MFFATNLFVLAPSVADSLSAIDAENVHATDYGSLTDGHEDVVVTIAVVPHAAQTPDSPTGEQLCPGLPVNDEKDDDDYFSSIAQPGPQVSSHISPEFPPPDILLSEAPEHLCGEECGRRQLYMQQETFAGRKVLL